mmetsp:Transcript_32906/g.104985  ORF Transcript_32906/g.104985 Transcript_32906/m.104985 type:complete len:233 (-) Transcript_32906:14-712(-)
MKVFSMFLSSRSCNSFMKVEWWSRWRAHIPPETMVEGTNKLPQWDDDSEIKACNFGRYGAKTGAVKAVLTIIDPAEWPTKEIRPTLGSGSPSSWHRCLIKLCTSWARRWPMGPIEPPVLSSFDCGDSTTALGNSNNAKARSSRMSNDDAYQPCCITIKCGPRYSPSSSFNAGRPGFNTGVGGGFFAEDEEVPPSDDSRSDGGLGTFVAVPLLLLLFFASSSSSSSSSSSLER